MLPTSGTEFHFYSSDVDKCAFDYFDYSLAQQRHVSWLFERASPRPDDPRGQQDLAFCHACAHSRSDWDDTGWQDTNTRAATMATDAALAWSKGVQTEADLVCEMLTKHCDGIWDTLQKVPIPDAQRDSEYRQVFRPFETVQDFRASTKLCPLGKTGRLTTVDELAAMTDQQLEPFRHVANLIFTGDAPSLLKTGDVCPLPKDVIRARPITVLDPIFKVVDAEIGRRLMKIAECYDLVPDCTFGFISGSSPEWPTLSSSP